MKTHYLFLEQSLPAVWDAKNYPARSFLGLVLWAERDLWGELNKLFPNLLKAPILSGGAPVAEAHEIVVRAFRKGVANPVASSLATCLGLEDSQVRADRIIVPDLSRPGIDLSRLQMLWREPAIEDVKQLKLSEWFSDNARLTEIPPREDDSWKVAPPAAFDLEFEGPELEALNQEAARQQRGWNRAELEVFAQTWSEHCKHKIFAAEIECVDTLNPRTDSLFKTHIRAPTFEVMEQRPGRYLSVFHDNAGVIALDTEKGAPTEWSACLKMETHNSPSAISPYGGASTGVVGVHRDILGTGLGAMPIANWDVLCFESPDHQQARPANALPADVIRHGVIKGIEDGGNQSGIPTVQGSVVFDPNFAVKPLVYAGAVGILPKKDVNKKARPGLTLYCVGGAVGSDGLRGAVMSSRDLRSADFVGSMVQVANAFTQRRVTDFLLEARDKGLIDCVTDNGAGGLASSVGEMASLSGGAEIDLTHLRLKFKGLLAWERLLSESQERMTVATSQEAAFEALAQSWEIPLDKLGALNSGGYFKVNCHGKTLVNISLKFLHEGCPKLRLKSSWSFAKEAEALARERPVALRPVDLEKDFLLMLESAHLASREGVVRRFDHEVQGRTLRKPFAGASQESPQDGSRLDIYESPERCSLVLTHGLAPWRKSIEENVLFAFDEALRAAVLSGARLETAGLLDNFCWSDPLRNDRRLWRLVRSCELLSQMCRIFSLPLISGKDSMKNNSKDFEAPQTLVVSLGASGGPRELIPAGFFSRANDVILALPPLAATMRDSVWERVFNSRAQGLSDDPALGAKATAAQNHEQVAALSAQLRARFAAIEGLIQKGWIRSAKDAGEGGLLTALFEMGLGRELGAELERGADPEFWLSEGLGSFVFGVDPHVAQEVVAALPEVQRLGVVARHGQIRFNGGPALEMKQLRAAYLKKAHEGFWN